MFENASPCLSSSVCAASSWILSSWSRSSVLERELPLSSQTSPTLPGLRGIRVSYPPPQSLQDQEYAPLTEENNKSEEKNIHFEAGIPILSPAPEDENAEKRRDRKAQRTYRSEESRVRQE